MWVKNDDNNFLNDDGNDDNNDDDDDDKKDQPEGSALAASAVLTNASTKNESSTQDTARAVFLMYVTRSVSASGAQIDSVSASSA